MRIEDVRGRLCAMKTISDRMDPTVLKYFGAVDCVSEEDLTKRVYESDMEIRRDRARPYSRWL